MDMGVSNMSMSACARIRMIGHISHRDVVPGGTSNRRRGHDRAGWNAMFPKGLHLAFHCQ